MTSRDGVKLAAVVLSLVAVAYVLIRVVGQVLQPPYVGAWRQPNPSLWILGTESDNDGPHVISCNVVFEQGPESGQGEIVIQVSAPVSIRPIGGTEWVEIGASRWRVPFRWSRVPTRNVPPSIRVEAQRNGTIPEALIRFIPEQQVFEWRFDRQRDELSLGRAGQWCTFARMQR